VPYFAQEIGLTFQEFLASESVFAATVVLMEVPSGWLADIWKRKSAIVLGGIFAATGMALLLPADGFFDTAVAQAFMGVGISLFSGADSALLYDALHQHGRADRYRVIEGRRHGFGMYAVALSSLVGAWLFTIDPILTVWGMIVSYLATAGFALFLADPERRRHIAAGRPNLRKLVAGNGVVIAAIGVAAVLFSATSVAMWAQQPYYIALGIEAKWFGLLMAIGFLAGGLGGQFGHHLDRWLGALPALITLWAVLVVAFLTAGLWPSWGGVALLLLGSAAWGAGWPQMQTIINQRVGSARRATVLSVAGAAIRLGFIPLSATIGLLNTQHGIAIAVLGLAGILFTLGGPALWLLWRAAGSHAVPGISIATREV
ncbi:MAG: MFS transporter, partial [Rhodospirillaceae bacterium]|nr:MFS transporter [Rhodospirillaceae bacterium]